MENNKTSYLITIGENNIDGVMVDEFEETLIFVGRLIERLNTHENYKGKYIYVQEYILSNNETYVKQDGLFSSRYLIEK